MRFSERTIPKTPGQLRDAISFTRNYACEGAFPDWCGLDFDGAFQRLYCGVEKLRKRFGAAKSDQIIGMLQTAKGHFELSESHYGSWLMQDVQEVISDRRPFAYPEMLYRWPVDPSAGDVTPEDVLREGEEE